MNELTAPQGGALRAVNVVVDVPDEYTTHRGMEASSDGGRTWSAATYYAGGLVLHSEAEGVLARYEGGVWTEYSGTYNAPDGERMAFQEANGTLFFTTSNGLYRLDGPSATPVPSGLGQGLPGTGSTTGSSGYLDEGYGVAYRHSWAINADAQGNERLIEGAPSPRLLVTNPTGSGSSKDVTVTWPIPAGLPAGAYNRTFRSDATLETVSPLDEVRQVYERAPTDAERAAGEFTFTDTTPDAVKGPGAYFSANSGEGIAQSNYKCALAHGLTLFNESVFAVPVDGVQGVELNMLGAVSVGQGLTFVPDVGGSETYLAGAAESFPGTFKTFAGTSTPSLDLAATVESLCRAINSRTNGILYAFAIDTDGTNPGGFFVQRRTLSQVPVTVYSVGAPQAWAPALRTQSSGTFNRAAMSSDVVVTLGFDHGFDVDEKVDITSTGNPDFSTGLKTISAVTANTFTYVEAGPAGSGTLSFSTTDALVITSSGTEQNAYAWSKQGEPDHWPLANLGTIAGATDTLWWGLPLDRFLFLGSDAGLYRLTGNARDGFSLMDGGVWDSTTSFLGRRNVAAIDGKGYAIARQGLVTWTEGGKPQSADIPIQDEIRSLVTAIPDTVAAYGFMWTDSTNHRLYVCLPQSAEDTAATVCHVYSTRTGAWTRLTSTFPGFEEGWLAGLAPKEGAGTSYVVPSQGGDFAEKFLSTRNTYTDADYQGPAGEGVPAKVTYLPLLAGEPGRMKQWTWTRIFTKEPTTKLGVEFATEWLPTTYPQLLPDIDPDYTGYEPVADPVRGIAWRTIVDKFHQRAKALTVSVSHDIPQEPLHLLGLEVKHRPYGGGQ